MSYRLYNSRIKNIKTKITNISLAFVLAFTSLATGPILLSKTASALSPITPSTNSQNAINGWAHVDLVSNDESSVTLRFISTRSFYSCFEYRTDGDTSQSTGSNYNSAILDGLYPFTCQNSSSLTKTIAANGYVEVRMVFGAEGDERFTWTRFDVVDTSTTQFVGSPKYVRANNGSDLSAQLVTPDTTTDVRFFVDGNTSSPLGGTNIGGAGATTSWWRLRTALPGGEHTITAQVEISGAWYDVSGSGTVYSLDSPWAEYVIPQAGQFFRPNDKVVRVKADDQFNQFKYMKTTVNGVTHTINRADCTDKGNYVLCDLQNLNLPEGPYTASTTTYTMANNRVDNLVSPQFTIDSTRPTLTNFQITSPSSVYGSSIPVSADATDTNGIDNVTFYVTTPRVSDNTCDGNGTHLSSLQEVLGSGNTYSAALDISGLNGDYCLNAIAEDVAANHSSPILRMKVTLDNTAPTVNFVSPTPAENDYVRGTITAHVQATDDNGMGSYYIRVWKGAFESGLSNLAYNSCSSAPGGTALGASQDITCSVDTSSWSDGTYVMSAQFLDGGSNWGKALRTIYVDNTRPNATITTPANNSFNKTGDFTITGNATDNLSGIDHVVVYVAHSPWSEGGYVVNNQTATYDPSTGDFTYDVSGLPEGTYVVKANAFDKAGNNHFASTVTITVDSTKPKIKNIALSDIVINSTDANPTLTATLKDAATNIASARYKISDASGTVLGWTNLSAADLSFDSGLESINSIIDVSSILDGNYTLKLQTFDQAGNKRNSTVDFSIDRTVPIVAVNTYSGTDTTPTLTGTVDDSTAGVEVTIDGTTYTATVTGNTWSVDVSTALTVGAYDVVATATDPAGNVGTDVTTDEVTITAVLGASTSTPSTPTVASFSTGSGNTSGSTGSGESSEGSTNEEEGNVKAAETQTVNLASDTGSNKDDTTKSSGAFLGLGWWWLLILATILGFLWFILGRRSEQE